MIQYSNVKKGRPESIISDYSKIPQFVFEAPSVQKQIQRI